MEIKAEFTFRPIGQGCFYTGLIEIRRNPFIVFNFVYDCGVDRNDSKRNLAEQTNLYKQELKYRQKGKPLINMVVISHFDWDHVSGITELLTGVKCNRLIIPYYEPFERLMLFASLEITDKNYVEFLSDPVNFFSNNDRFDIDEIVIIGGDNTGYREANISNSPEGPERRLLGLGELDLLLSEQNELGFKDELQDPKLTFDKYPEEFRGFDHLKMKTAVKYMHTPYRISITFWEFYFYYRKYEGKIKRGKKMEDMVNKITPKVDKLIKQCQSQWDRKRLRNKLKKQTKFTLKDLFHKEYIKKLRSIYEPVFGRDLNCTSLVTFHGPLIDLAQITKKSFFQLYTSCDWHHGHKNFGTLLMGDIDIENKAKLQQLILYFKLYLKDVCIFQVPHHGAANNWPFKNASKEIYSFCRYVINHGLGRLHHPSVDVIDDLKRKGKDHRISLANEIQSVHDYLHIWPRR